MWRGAAAIFMGLATASAWAQPAGYDPRAAFAPLLLPQPVNAYRSASGTPGPSYWQNRADYELRATLDPASKSLSGEATITYSNNSPDALDSLWLHLDQNIYRSDSRASVSGARRRQQNTDGFVLDEVSIDQGGRVTRADYIVSDTRMQIRLTAPLRAQTRMRVTTRRAASLKP